VQYSPAGAAAWSVQPGGAAYAAGTMLSGVAVAANSDPVVVGCPAVSNPQTAAPGCLLAELSASDGSQVWLTQFGFPPVMPMISGGIAVDGSNNILTSGYTSQPLLSAFSASDAVYLAKFNSAGSPVWVQQFSDTTTDHFNILGDVSPGGPALALDSAGNAYVGDNAFTTPSTPAGASYSEPFLLKFGP
jgi:hypothetical protein